VPIKLTDSQLLKDPLKNRFMASPIKEIKNQTQIIDFKTLDKLDAIV